MSNVYSLLASAIKLFNDKGLAKKKSGLGYNARSIDDLQLLVSEVLSEVGLATTTGLDITDCKVIDTPNGKQTYSCSATLTITLYDADGLSVSSYASGWFTGSDPTKLAGQAGSYLYKEAWFKMGAIPVSGQDDVDFPTPAPTAPTTATSKRKLS